MPLLEDGERECQAEERRLQHPHICLREVFGAIRLGAMGSLAGNVSSNASFRNSSCICHASSASDSTGHSFLRKVVRDRAGTPALVFIGSSPRYDITFPPNSLRRDSGSVSNTSFQR